MKSGTMKFCHVQKGDTVMRLLAGQIPHPLPAYGQTGSYLVEVQ